MTGLANEGWFPCVNPVECQPSMCVWCWLWTFVWTWLWRCVPRFFHPDLWGILGYAATIAVGALLIPSLVYAIRANRRFKRLKKTHGSDAPDAHEYEDAKSDRDYLLDAAILILIIFEACMGMLSLHLQNDDAEAQIERLDKTVTELHLARVTMQDEFNLLKTELEREAKERWKKPILSLVVRRTVNSDWQPLGDTADVDRYFDRPCMDRSLQPSNIFLGVKNDGDVKATDGHLTFVATNGFNVECPVSYCTFQRQSIETQPGLEVRASFSVSAHETFPITLTFSGGNNGGHDTDPLLLVGIKMKAAEDSRETKFEHQVTITKCQPVKR